MVDRDYATTAHVNESNEKPAASRFQRLRHGLLRRAWYVHPGAHLRVTISPSQTYKALEISAKPSVKHLQLRNVFVRGRRYFIFPRGGGFRMITTHKVPWFPRRTTASAVLFGDFEKIDDATTRLKMTSRIKIVYLLRSFLWPTFMTSMLVFMTWPVVIIALCIAALYGLSWVAHRYNAALEAYEMVFFIEKALEDFIPDPPSILPAQTTSADVIVESDFAQEWDKFVDEMQDD